jgi:hypothetical protein
MKSKTLLLLCLFSGIGLIQLSAQAWPPPPPDNKNGTGSVVTLETINGYSVPVFSSNGQLIDWLAGDVTAHYVRHYKNGVWLSEIADFYGEVVSVGLDFNSGTGEEFSIKDQYKTRDIGLSGDGHFSAKGNQGSRIILFYHFDFFWSGEPLYSTFTGFTVTLVKAVKQ